MSGRIKRIPKTRSAIQHCQEKHSCIKEQAVAVYKCTECETLQCETCESVLHAPDRGGLELQFHSREILSQPSPNQLCNPGANKECTEFNFADIFCENCDKQLCFKCNDLLHSAVRKKDHHKTITFKTYCKRLEEAKSRYTDQTVNSVNSFDDFEDFMSIPLSGDIERSNESPHFLSSNTTPSVNSSESNRPRPGMAVRTALTNPLISRSDGSVGEPPAMISTSEDSPLSSLNAAHFNSVDQCQQTDSKLLTSLWEQSSDLYKDCKSFVLSDEQEIIKIKSSTEFVKNLECDVEDSVKVVSIFGNTGDGKSYTLNHTFFGGNEVFPTSSKPTTCTVGVWAAYDRIHKAIILDTEGLLGVTANQNKRTRLLLKILAISDIVIYRTRAERLHNDLFQFLSDASKAYQKHFNIELKAAGKRCSSEMSTLGPVVILFHETQHTDPLDTGLFTHIYCVCENTILVSSCEALKQRFVDLDLSYDAFNAIIYVGIRTDKNTETDFMPLLSDVKKQLANTSIRSSRRPDVIFSALQVLNEKFSGQIENTLPQMFPDQYFSCPVHCKACGTQCQHSMNHLKDSVPHEADKRFRCSYHHQYDNQIFICKKCYDDGKEVPVIPKMTSSNDDSWFGVAKYAWAGYVLECAKCGVIYRSRQYWYGNQEPEETGVVRTELKHIWIDGAALPKSAINAGRQVIDGLQKGFDPFRSISQLPARKISEWVHDQIAPDYWVPNRHLKSCYVCEHDFTESDPKHHCRQCGKGVCDGCSQRRKPVPSRGWGDVPVRVCDTCFDRSEDQRYESDSNISQTMPRKVAEAVGSLVGPATRYPIDLLKETTRPDYWTPDSECLQCAVCDSPFSERLTLHHCRACGHGVCDPCSRTLRPVPSHGWDHPVRNCDKCVTSTTLDAT